MVVAAMILSMLRGTMSQTCTAGYSNSGTGEFNLPTDVATDASGNVYVADYNNNAIRKLTGSTWTTIGGSSCTSAGCTAGYSDSGNGQFNAPFGVAVDASGNVYVADYNNNAIRKLMGSTWTTIGGACALPPPPPPPSSPPPPSPPPPLPTCPVGTYSASCTPCPAGTYSTAIGAMSLSDCTSCPVGTVSTVAGANSSSTCIAPNQSQQTIITSTAYVALVFDIPISGACSGKALVRSFAPYNSQAELDCFLCREHGQQRFGQWCHPVHFGHGPGFPVDRHCRVWRLLQSCFLIEAPEPGADGSRICF